MASSVTITFSQTGVQPPVYVTSSLSGWTTLEMNVEEDKTASDNLVFSKEFSDVAEGSYQYKIRVGEDNWVLDESKETATDDQGIRNNVVHVKSSNETNSMSAASDATTVQEPTSDMSSLKASPVLPTKLPENRKDSTMDEEQLPSVPVPFVVEKVANQEHPVHGDLEQVHLSADASKRAADAEPDFEEVKADSPVEPAPPKTPDVPLLVVEKTDDRPAYGDDFGNDATNAQKAAHDMRTADASPDRLVITPESHVEPGSEEEQAAPLFRHESFQEDVPSPPSMNTIDEESTDQMSSEAAIDTPPEPDEAEDGDDELNQGPLLSHETGFGIKSAELENGPLLSHEADSDADVADKLDKAPLLSHETGFHGDSGIASDEEDELNRFPLMSHETGFSDYQGSEIRTDSDFGYDDRIQLGAHDDDEYDYPDGDDGDAPLLPHERDFAVASKAGSDYSQEEAPFSLQNQPTFGYETDNARELFGGAGRANIFRARTSSLPHKMPQSDAEDENLNDPSLERFPTSRQQILERVKTIGLHLPEDETMHDLPQSPQMSILSQACSSVDLAPVKSYTSLASVPEAEYSDDEEDQDVESLPSPVYIGQKHLRVTSGTSVGRVDFVRDPQATPMPDESKQLGLIADDKNEVSSNHSMESSEAESVDKHDGAKDVPTVLSAKHNRIQDRGDFRSIVDAISTPTKAMSPTMGPVSSESKTTAKEEHPVSNLDSELRQRRALVEESSQPADAPSTATDGTSIKDKIAKAVAPTLAQQQDSRNENMVQHFFRVVFGPVGRFLTACVGDRKRASASVIVLGGAAVAGYYYVAVAS